MNIYYSRAEQAFRPRHSFFNGRFVPYPDVPERTQAILEALRGDGRFALQEPPLVRAGRLHGVHAPAYLDTLAEVCGRLKPHEEFFPPVIQQAPQLLRARYARIRAGYYTVDTSTPLLSGSLEAALGAASTALAGAEALRGGERVVYALARPPGHHAGRSFWAGYCLVNHAALAAASLAEEGRVAVLDVDYHHGNGTQDIFYDRDDVLYVSLHCRPEEAYPYTTGADDETGTGRGLGRNRNLPLPGGTGWAGFREALESALETVAAFRPDAVVVSAGFDTLEGDPIATFRLRPPDFRPMGERIASLGVPLLVVQEGGYRVDALGAAAHGFLSGLLPSTDRA